MIIVMRRFLVVPFFILATLCLARGGENVRFAGDSESKKIDVYFGDSYFTSFLYSDSLEKQVLYPIVTASGKEITRGFPVRPRPFERADHPHQVGLWFNFGDVNGLDFWNNSYAIKQENKHRYGSIRFKEIVETDPKTGKLVVAAEWVDNNGEVLLEEISSYVFKEENGARSILRSVVLTAKKEVTFTENKEGMFGLRVGRAFEEPTNTPSNLLDSEGKRTATRSIHNEGVNGVYRNGDGLTGGEVWGTRSPWVALRAELDREPITVVVMDHPENPNYPGWSHARGYGLFGINNMGGSTMDKNAAAPKIVLGAGENIAFKYKVVIGGELADPEIVKMVEVFNQE